MTNNRFQMLPAVHELLGQLEVSDSSSHAMKVNACRAALEAARRAIKDGLPAPSTATLLRWAQDHMIARQQLSLRNVINATGVIIHTNLGRAPLSDEAMAAVTAVAQQYNTLEYDLAHGKRGRRQTHVEALLCEITGCEAAVVVNNNAAAVYLILNALAAGREIIVSRGQLVEIGGGFRIPDVMRQGGARLVEVGTTNRTRATDYATAITDDTVALMRIHASNFKQIGFIESVSLAEMVQVAHKHQVMVFDDLGSGTLLDTSPFGLAPEPTIQQSVQAGADVIMFSGDKLLGGPQAGIVIGRKAVIDILKRFPLMRALRPDKMTMAALTRTLMHYRDEEALEKIPVWQMIVADRNRLDARAHQWQKVVGGDVVDAESTVGGGSLPGDSLPTRALSIDVQAPDTTLEKLRHYNPPIIARIQDDRVLLDPRTVFPHQDGTLINGLQAVL